jgi:hypothetical protein
MLLSAQTTRGRGVAGGGRVGLYNRCLLLVACTVVFLVVLLYRGHRLTCRFNLHLCTPFAELLHRVYTEGRLEDYRSATVSNGGAKCDRNATSFNCPNLSPSFEVETLTPSKKFLLLGEPRGGSTFTERMVLDGHKNIHCAGEVLYRFKALYSDEWDTYRKALDKDLSKRACDPAVEWTGAKINMGQVPSKLWPQFVDYVLCNNITVGGVMSFLFGSDKSGVRALSLVGFASIVFG